MKLGGRVSLATVSRYVPKAKPMTTTRIESIPRLEMHRSVDPWNSGPRLARE
jgi:hypothetical protein